MNWIEFFFEFEFNGGDWRRRVLTINFFFSSLSLRGEGGRRWASVGGKEEDGINKKKKKKKRKNGIKMENVADDQYRDASDASDASNAQDASLLYHQLNSISRPLVDCK